MQTFKLKTLYIILYMLVSILVLIALYFFKRISINDSYILISTGFIIKKISLILYDSVKYIKISDGVISEKFNIYNLSMYITSSYGNVKQGVGYVTKNNLNKIGFDQAIDFPISMTSSKFLSGDKFESEVQLADTGYGQGKVLINPIHMSAMYTAFVNEGNMIKPYIEYKEDVSQPEFYIKNAFSKETANAIKEDLVQVIEDEGGTAHNVQMENVRLAGKTGTAEIKNSQEDTEGSEIGWFCTFVADENSEKQILIVSMVEDINQKNKSNYVTSKVKSILKKML